MMKTIFLILFVVWTGYMLYSCSGYSDGIETASVGTKAGWLIGVTIMTVIWGIVAGILLMLAMIFRKRSKGDSQ